MDALAGFFSGSVVTELVLLLFCVVLCAVIGIERQLSQKSAGLRTHVLVGLGSAGFTLVSAYGFAGGEGSASVVDPTRIAAQIVSGIGFLGAGLIFMRRDVVRGLTTAASIWLTAAVGMACGAGMLPLATMLVAMHLLVTRAVAPLVLRITARTVKNVLRLRYEQGSGALREVLNLARAMGVRLTLEDTRSRHKKRSDRTLVTITFRVIGRVPVSSCIEEFSRVDGIRWVRQGLPHHDD